MLERVLDTSRLAQLYPLLRTAKHFAVRQAHAPITPTASEIAYNRRSRSAMVHVLERVERTSWLPSLPPQDGDLTQASLAGLFKRPRAVVPRAIGRPDAGMATLPPRTSGACTAVNLG